MIFLLSLLIFIFDQLSKAVIVRVINPGETLAIINNIFHITLIFNPGGAFGIFAHNPFLVTVVSASIVAFIVISLIRRSPSHILYPIRGPRQRQGIRQRQIISNRVYALPLSMILGGALGNLADRLRFGFVIDFLDFQIWPVFNIADIAITTGAILLVWRISKNREKVKVRT